MDNNSNIESNGEDVNQQITVEKTDDEDENILEEESDEDESEEEERLKRYKSKLEQYADDLKEVINKSTDYFEKQISYLSAGALGLSFILIEKVLKDITKTEDKGLLILGWVLLTATLLLNLISHHRAISSHYKTVQDVVDYNCGNSDNLDHEKIETRNKIIRVINLITIITLILGILSIVFYTSINILNMSDESKHKGQELPKETPKPNVPPQPIEKAEKSNESLNNRESKVPDIIDKGHTGFPPEKPGKK